MELTYNSLNRTITQNLLHGEVDSFQTSSKLLLTPLTVIECRLCLSSQADNCMGYTLKFCILLTSDLLVFETRFLPSIPLTKRGCLSL
jgi:hypothetical protein